MDRRRDELLRNCTPDFRRQIDDYLSEQQGGGQQVHAQLAQPQQGRSWVSWLGLLFPLLSPGHSLPGTC